MTKKKDTGGLSGDDVIAYLKKHPHFLKEYPEACDLLIPPRAHDRKSGIVDFQEHMVKRLREDRDGIIQEARVIVETSRANMNNLTRVHRAVLMVLEAQNFEDFIHVLTMDLASLLDVDIVSLVVETDGDTIPHINMPGIHAVTQGTVNLLMKDRPVILEASISGFEEIYGGGAGLVKSQALLRLNIGTHAPAAMLAFGSRAPDLFGDGQGTEQISFLAQVVERTFRAWLSI